MSSSEEPQRPIKTAPKRKSVKAEDGAAADDGPPAKIARVKTTKNLGTPKRVEKDEMDRMKFKLVKAILDLGTLDKVKLVEMVSRKDDVPLGAYSTDHFRCRFRAA